MRRLAAVFAIVLPATPLAAENFDTNILFAGQWQFFNDATGPGACLVTLEPGGTAEKPAGSLLLTEECPREFPNLKGVSGWRGNQLALELVTADGTVAYSLDNAGPESFVASIDGAQFSLNLMVDPNAANKKQAEADALAGKYLFKAVKGKTRGCVIELGNQGSYDQYQSVLGEDCEQQYSFLMVLSGWEPMPKGSIRLVGAEGSDMVIFKKNKKGVLEGVSENDGNRYTFSRVK